MNVPDWTASEFAAALAAERDVAADPPDDDEPDTDLADPEPVEVETGGEG